MTFLLLCHWSYKKRIIFMFCPKGRFHYSQKCCDKFHKSIILLYLRANMHKTLWQDANQFSILGALTKTCFVTLSYLKDRIFWFFDIIFYFSILNINSSYRLFWTLFLSLTLLNCTSFYKNKFSLRVLKHKIIR